MKSSIPDWLRSRPVAHRGLHDGVGRPENSLAAFSAAADAGYPVELDVRLTADGHSVVFHDADVARLTGATGDIAAMTLGEVSSLRLLGTDQCIPTLNQVLEHIGERTPLLVEIKNEGDSAGTLERNVCELLDAHPCDAAVQSFHPASVEALALHAPERARGFLMSPISAGTRWLVFVDALQQFVRAAEIDFVGIDIRGLPCDPLSRVSHRITTVGWTTRNTLEEARARRWVDNVIFEGYTPTV